MSSVVHKAILKLFPTKEELCEIVAGCVTPLEAWDKKSVLELPITSLLKVSIYPLVPLTHLSAPVKGGSVWGVFSTPAGLVPKIVISPHALDGDTPRLRVSLPELLGDKPTYSSVHSLTLDEWKSRDFTEIVIRRIEESLLQMAATPFLYNNKWHKSIMGGEQGRFLRETYLNPGIWHHVCHSVRGDGKVAHVPKYIQKSIKELKCVWGLSSLPFILTVSPEQTRFFSHVVGWLYKRGVWYSSQDSFMTKE